MKIGAIEIAAHDSMFNQRTVELLSAEIKRNLCRKLVDGVQFGKTYVLRVGTLESVERASLYSLEYRGEMRVSEITEDAVRMLKEMGFIE